MNPTELLSGYARLSRFFGSVDSVDKADRRQSRFGWLSRFFGQVEPFSRSQCPINRYRKNRFGKEKIGNFAGRAKIPPKKGNGTSA